MVAKMVYPIIIMVANDLQKILDGLENSHKVLTSSTNGGRTGLFWFEQSTPSGPMIGPGNYHQCPWLAPAFIATRYWGNVKKTFRLILVTGVLVECVGVLAECVDVLAKCVGCRVRRCPIWVCRCPGRVSISPHSRLRRCPYRIYSCPGRVCRYPGWVWAHPEKVGRMRHIYISLSQFMDFFSSYWHKWIIYLYRTYLDISKFLFKTWPLRFTHYIVSNDC